MLGFHDFVAKQIGAERTMKLMTSYRVSEDAEELMGYARDYGLNIGNISHLKRALRPFIGGQYE